MEGGSTPFLTHGHPGCQETEEPQEIRSQESAASPMEPEIIVESSVRSRQQIYARHRSLVVFDSVFDSVSSGAEVLSNGDILIFLVRVPPLNHLSSLCRLFWTFYNIQHVPMNNIQHNKLRVKRVSLTQSTADSKVIESLGDRNRT